MQTAYERENSATKLLRAASPTLSLTALVMLADFVVCLVAMAIDSRHITGINAWFKPANFGISSAITCLTLAGIASYLSDWPELRKWASRVFAASIIVEIVVINLQAARGTASHFNFSTPFNRSAFIVMGISIGTLWLSLVGAAAGEHRRLRFFVRVAGLAGTSRPGAPQAGWSHSTGSVNHDGFHVRWVSPDSFPFTAEFRE
jgi:hypothetical protein